MKLFCSLINKEQHILNTIANETPVICYHYYIVFLARHIEYVTGLNMFVCSTDSFSKFAFILLLIVCFFVVERVFELAGR